MDKNELIDKTINELYQELITTQITAEDRSMLKTRVAILESLKD